MSRLRQRKILSKVMFAVLGLAVFVFSYQLGNRYAQPGKPDTSAFLLPEPITIEPFSLIDEEGASFGSGDFKGYWTLVMPGDHQHASCKQLMARYVLAWNRLAHDKPLQNMTRVAFLSLVAKSHTNNGLKSFIEFIHPDFVGLSGGENDVRRFAAQLGLAEYENKSVQCNEPGSIVALINPEGQLSALFTGVSDPAIIAHDLETIVHR
jgi:cytochrome oxidase Cu insertion factor (SCO1/SenC/PrrC family)